MILASLTGYRTLIIALAMANARQGRDLWVTHNHPGIQRWAGTSCRLLTVTPDTATVLVNNGDVRTVPTAEISIAANLDTLVGIDLVTYSGEAQPIRVTCCSARYATAETALAHACAPESPATTRSPFTGSGTVPAGTSTRGNVRTLTPTRVGNGTSRSWRRDINGRAYSFTLVTMPSGETRIFVSEYNGYVGGTRFGTAWSPVREIILPPAAVSSTLTSDSLSGTHTSGPGPTLTDTTTETGTAGSEALGAATGPTMADSAGTVRPVISLRKPTMRRMPSKTMPTADRPTISTSARSPHNEAGTSDDFRTYNGR